MYGLLRDSILFPQNLLAYRNKRFWFIFVYVLILSALVSMPIIIRVAGYSGNSDISTALTGCSVTEGSLVCEGTAYDPDRAYAFFGYSAYFVNPGDMISEPAANRLVFQGDRMYLYMDGVQTVRANVSSLLVLTSATSFDGMMAGFESLVRYLSAPYAIFGTLILLLSFALLGTLFFSRLFAFVRFAVIYKLVLFAMTPVALFLLFNNLLALDPILFWVLLFISYRSVFVLQQVLTRETLIHLGETGKGPFPGPVVDTQVPGEPEPEAESAEADEEDEAPDSDPDEGDDSDSEE